MKTKKVNTVFCLKTRQNDLDDWSEPECYRTKKERDKAGTYCRCLGGLRTHSYEEVMVERWTNE